MLAAPCVLLLVPAVYLVAALLPEELLDRLPGDRWRAALAAAAIAPLVAVLAAAAYAFGEAGVFWPDVRLGSGFWSVTPSVRLDGLTVVVLTLITGIAGVILRFSSRYLAGEPGLPRYRRWFLATMAAVSLLVVTNDLLVLALAWTVSSLALHQLLTFYGERPAALVAAHKKFLLSRVADVAILGAVVLVWRTMGTLRIDLLLAQAATLGAVPAGLQAAGLLLVLGIALRSAQLPFHGWLIQVMEAPTPVSALLHAGIVNVGGFVLIRLAPLVSRLDGAATVLVVVGTTTAVLAGLVMTTRVSVKVALAWSTCAQMGFLLLECGLGAYDLALLHLVGHSLYKAHAFLASGRAVEHQVLRTMAPAGGPAPGRAWVAATLAGGLMVLAVGALLGGRIDAPAGSAVALLVIALAVAPLLVGDAGRWPSVDRVAGAVALIAAAAAGHALVRVLVPDVAAMPSPGVLRPAIVAAGILGLYAVQAVLAVRPSGAWARTLYPTCFAGFYLDELVTRLTFRVWPPRPIRLPSLHAAPRATALREVSA